MDVIIINADGITKHVYSDEKLQAHINHGWAVLNEKVQEPADKGVDIADEVARKRGRPFKAK